ncbi:MAG TPA: hypothetical protein VD931_18075 [Baekduia sp.]|nr:hypothetical protein [Baekduia sp.]
MRRARVLGVLAAAVLPAAAPVAARAQDGPPLRPDERAMARTLTCSDDVRGADRDPVLLIPGTTVDTREDFSWTWEPALRAQGRPYCTYDPPAKGMADIQDSGEHVVRHLRAIRAMSGRKVDVVGHSQGGMVARWALRFWPDTRQLVDDLIGMAPSNHGTDAAQFLCALGGCAPSIWQQRSDSAFMRALNSEAETYAPVDYTVIYTRTDQVVIPNADAATGSSSLRGGTADVTNVALQEVCPADLNEHLAIGLYDNVAHHLALDALDHDGPAVPDRVPRSICRTTTMRSVHRVTGFTSLVDAGAVLGLTLLTSQRVPAEPALRPYAAGAAARAAAPAPMSTERRAAARTAARRLQRAADEAFLVPVGVRASGFGHFRQRSTDGNDVPGLRAALGAPSSMKRSSDGSSCVLRWSALGVTARVVQFGSADTAGSACRSAMWVSARLSDRRWHTRRGVRPGSSAAAARRAAVGCRRLRGDQCVRPPVTLDTFVSECGAVEIPAVRAVLRRGRVAWLDVRWRGCE